MGTDGASSDDPSLFEHVDATQSRDLGFDGRPSGTVLVVRDLFAHLNEAL